MMRDIIDYLVYLTAFQFVCAASILGIVVWLPGLIRSEIKRDRDRRDRLFGKDGA